MAVPLHVYNRMWVHSHAQVLKPTPPHLMADRGCAAATAPSAARLVVFAARRTGSSLLVEELRAHPAVLMHGELFHVRELTDRADGYAGKRLPPENLFETRRAHPTALLRWVGCHAEGKRVVGLKLFRDHLRPTNWPRLAQWCDVCVLLRREDVRAQYRSLMWARRTGRWKGRSARAPYANLSLDDGYREWSGNQAHWYRALESMLSERGSNASVVHLTFERHLAGVGGPDLQPLWRALRLSPPARALQPGRG